MVVVVVVVVVVVCSVMCGSFVGIGHFSRGLSRELFANSHGTAVKFGGQVHAQGGSLLTVTQVSLLKEKAKKFCVFFFFRQPLSSAYLFSFEKGRNTFGMFVLDGSGWWWK